MLLGLFSKRNGGQDDRSAAAQAAGRTTISRIHRLAAELALRLSSGAMSQQQFYKLL